MQITEHNIATGETIVRDATESELKKFQSWKEYDEKLEAVKAEAEAKRAAAEAKLAALGLTADDLKALGL